MGRRYITLDQTSDSLPGLYSKVVNVEDPVSTLHQATTKLTDAAVEPEQSFSSAESAYRQEDRHENDTANQHQRRLQIKQQQPALEQQHRQQQVSKQERQPFKQLQHSHIRQPAQLELQHLHLQKATPQKGVLLPERQDVESEIPLTPIAHARQQQNEDRVNDANAPQAVNSES